VTPRFAGPTLFLVLLAAAGLEVRGLMAGAHGVRRFEVSVYFVRSEPSAVTKVLIAR
jgi:hypothetical protein